MGVKLIKKSNLTFWKSFGWYSGEPFNLISVSLFNIEYDVLTILDIRFGKFVIGFGVFFNR